MAPNGKAESEATLMDLVINKISLSKFNEGGAAILAADKRNHQKDIAGNINIRPLDRNRLREFVDI